MLPQERTEYHWIENRVVPRFLKRPALVKQWRFNRSEKTLIATIEEHERSVYLEKGPAHSPAREVDVGRLHRGLLVDHQFQTAIEEKFHINLTEPADQLVTLETFSISVL